LGDGGGGGILNPGTATVTYCTISGNSSAWLYGPAGGISNGGKLDLYNTILSGNVMYDDLRHVGKTPDDFDGTINSLGHNLIGSGVTTYSGFDPTDLLNVDPRLGPLQDNGGPTFTHALLPGSPAINAGDNTAAPRFDQRGEGYPRIVGGTIDIGAFESQATSSVVADPGFEQVAVGAGNYQYRPAGSPWSFAGPAGVSGNYSGFTAGNPAAPDGGQVAFLQRKGSMSQAVSGGAAGSYVITFYAAQRGNWQESAQDFQVLVDDVVVGTFTPADTTYRSYATASVTVSDGPHTISFKGLDSAGGDNTAFVDAVTISRASATELSDAGFEQVVVGAGNYRYAPAGSPWTFSGNAGITGNDSGFTAGNPAAPAGGQVAFLQVTGSMSQAVAGWTAGSYVVSFDAAQRGNWQESAQDFKVLVDDVVVGIFTPADTSYHRYTTAAFTVTEGTHTITFKGLDTAGGDNTAFVDAVTIARAETAELSDPGFEQVAVGAGNYQYAPAGSPWAFTGNAGITGNDSGFTAGNPAAPEGDQVAFLQKTGSMSQAVAGWAAGTYVVSFDAAQRGNWQESEQDFQVLVDDVVVGTFTPADTSYRAYATASFTVSAGTHTITFKGLDTAGGDNTAFIDAVQIMAG
jgi:hypothetical protein